jgi:hypothetical protein
MFVVSGMLLCQSICFEVTLLVVAQPLQWLKITRTWIARLPCFRHEFVVRVVADADCIDLACQARPVFVHARAGADNISIAGSTLVSVQLVPRLQIDPTLLWGIVCIVCAV